MSAAALEAFLARLYTEGEARRRFEADPEGEARRAGLSPADRQALAQCDRIGLRMASESFSRKRAQHGKHRRPWYRRVLGPLFRRRAPR